MARESIWTHILSHRVYYNSAPSINLTYVKAFQTGILHSCKYETMLSTSFLCTISRMIIKLSLNLTLVLFVLIIEFQKSAHLKCLLRISGISRVIPYYNAFTSFYRDTHTHTYSSPVFREKWLKVITITHTHRLRLNLKVM